MYKIDQYLILKNPKGLKQHGWRGALVARVVDPNKFPEYKKQLEEYFAHNLSATKNFVAVEWAKCGSLTAVDGFYLAERFKPIEHLVSRGEYGNSYSNVQS